MTSLLSEAAATTSNDALDAASERAIQLAHRVLRRDDTITALREKIERGLERKKAQVQHSTMHLVDANPTTAKNKTTISLLHTWVKSLETQIHAAGVSNDTLLATQLPGEVPSLMARFYPICGIRQLVDTFSNNNDKDKSCQTHWLPND
ncbi:hypothetical protein SDRG_06634 [Saprolegnia diclina VS20]|uniref:Uncharacterized protein n=1 Tax=Saprolegnia diclina (strain VS20) TaxID=1156394 RepID=T0QPX0_SAPDV|nr:hypothetical protein SDRG_06634 [Saprolegnia diclina VS20]EQC35885.1 hypothetical protein SDRG_06634 [Saprolegnia diclina VS20]|eukprot:XP_008610647.1 hypothetical protein SDRG_06634 [Saprolegnia diclina VS20]